ncbi:hypothetical protein [Acuticoccus sediminis]|uniref:hypothetical protein n=1 Tax=Acuticoccus sediminis TaxID=2184697 RepID=UPI001CFDCB2D|nr:hypothetical protein [Acuticoccus sediminis]
MSASLSRRALIAGVGSLPLLSVVPALAENVTADEVVEAVAAYPVGLWRITEKHIGRSRELSSAHRNILRSARRDARLAGFDLQRQWQAVIWAGFQHRKVVLRDVVLPTERREDWADLPDHSRRMAELETTFPRVARPIRFQLINPWA